MPGYHNHGRNARFSRKAPFSISQNFLTSAVTINTILKRTSITKNDHVLEIGPGKGHITRALANRCSRVTAVELDARLYQVLQQRFDGVNGVKLVHMDFLKYKLPSGGCYKVFSNIPFNHTTDILRKLTESANPPEEIWLVTEKGAAKRFCGKPAENTRSLMLKPYYDMEIAYYFKREDFHPLPGVDIVLLHLKKKPSPDISKCQAAAYRRFVETGLARGLSGLLTPKQVSAALRSGGVAPDVTPANMLYVQWLCLFRQWGG
jgi:23S rRNA (adenine-N6)-dimethyltransferase